MPSDCAHSCRNQSRWPSPHPRGCGRERGFDFVGRVQKVVRGLEVVPHVFRLVDDSRVERVPVHIGYEDDSLVEIRSGLQAGERVTVAGSRDLSDGDPVRVFRELGTSESEKPVQ